jgi:hypothetical protein
MRLGTPSFWKRSMETNRLSETEPLSSLLEEHLSAEQDHMIICKSYLNFFRHNRK